MRNSGYYWTHNVSPEDLSVASQHDLAHQINTGGLEESEVFVTAVVSVHNSALVQKTIRLKVLFKLQTKQQLFNLSIYSC